MPFLSTALCGSLRPQMMGLSCGQRKRSHRVQCHWEKGRESIQRTDFNATSKLSLNYSRSTLPYTKQGSEKRILLVFCKTSAIVQVIHGSLLAKSTVPLFLPGSHQSQSIGNTSLEVALSRPGLLYLLITLSSHHPETLIMLFVPGDNQSRHPSPEVFF